MPWIDRCVASLQAQTIAPSIEVIFADNASTDGSTEYLEKTIPPIPGYRFLKIGKNLGFGAGSNEAAKLASGAYLFFLNPDVWLEPDCIERLYEAAESSHASAASALVLDYDSNEPQNWGGGGIDIFGIGVPEPLNLQEGIINFSSCFFFIRRHVFKTIGEFDPEFFTYSEELDINTRLSLAGEKIIYVPRALIHHQGSIILPGEAKVRAATSMAKRFYSNRNHLLTLLKCAHSLVFILIINSILLFFVEAIVGMVLWRRLDYFKRTFTDVIKDCWRLRGHISTERARIAGFRKKSDWALFKNFTWRLNRIHHLHEILSKGFPKMR